jgi:acyl-CoA synthetase (AMP-forming)/AMP-acid ligase II
MAGATASGHGFARAVGRERDDRALVCVPLHHVAGLAILARARVTGTPMTVHPGFDVAAVASVPADVGATVVSGGVNVSPTTVEAVLADAPGVRDVCVTGAPDDEWGERVVAFVVPDDAAAPPTVEALRGFAGEHLSRVQLPKLVVVVDAIPRSPGGKVLCRELRAPA